jgi:hypothetical protein
MLCDEQNKVLQTVKVAERAEYVARQAVGCRRRRSRRAVGCRTYRINCWMNKKLQDGNVRLQECRLDYMMIRTG